MSIFNGSKINNPEITPDNLEKKPPEYNWSESRLCNRIAVEILDEKSKKKYTFSERSRKWISGFARGNNCSEFEIILLVLENFNKNEGGLPGQLTEEYVQAAFCTENVKKKMDSDNLDFYQAISALSLSAKQAGIFLDESAVDRAVKLAKSELVGAEVPEESE